MARRSHAEPEARSGHEIEQVVGGDVQRIGRRSGSRRPARPTSRARRPGDRGPRRWAAASVPASSSPGHDHVDAVHRVAVDRVDPRGPEDPREHATGRDLCHAARSSITRSSNRTRVQRPPACGGPRATRSIPTRSPGSSARAGSSRWSRSPSSGRSCRCSPGGRRRSRRSSTPRPATVTDRSSWRASGRSPSPSSRVGCADVAARLAAAGVGRGDRVAMAGRPSLDHCLVVLGTMARGAVATVLNPAWTDDEVAHARAATSPALALGEAGSLTFADLLSGPAPAPAHRRRHRRRRGRPGHDHLHERDDRPPEGRGAVPPQRHPLLLVVGGHDAGPPARDPGCGARGRRPPAGGDRLGAPVPHVGAARPARQRGDLGHHAGRATAGAVGRDGPPRADRAPPGHDLVDRAHPALAHHRSPRPRPLRPVVARDDRRRRGHVPARAAAAHRREAARRRCRGAGRLRHDRGVGHAHVAAAPGGGRRPRVGGRGDGRQRGRGAGSRGSAAARGRRSARSGAAAPGSSSATGATRPPPPPCWTATAGTPPATTDASTVGACSSRAGCGT